MYPRSLEIGKTGVGLGKVLSKVDAEADAGITLESEDDGAVIEGDGSSRLDPEGAWDDAVRTAEVETPEAMPHRSRLQVGFETIRSRLCRNPVDDGPTGSNLLDLRIVHDDEARDRTSRSFQGQFGLVADGTHPRVVAGTEQNARRCAGCIVARDGIGLPAEGVDSIHQGAGLGGCVYDIDDKSGDTAIRDRSQ